MQLIKIVIVDDEKRVRASLKSVLELHYPDAAVIAEADDVQQATDVIKLHKPDVVLLDIKMPGGTGFDVLKQLMPFTFKVIFITAYDEYAIQAFKFSALDYLLKPVIPQELVNTLEKARQQVNIENLAGQFNVFLNNTGSLACETKKIVLNCQDKLHIISVNDIINLFPRENIARW
ncbi:MAG: response regulator [Bacteroidia bacterium]|nr:response regulator [Bacteroidia bacterium]